MMKFFKNNLFVLFIITGWLMWVLYWAWVLPYNMAPDECLHFKTAQFIQTQNRLPIMDKEEITFINEKECFGTTYLSSPLVNYVTASLFIRLGNRVGIERDYLAARISSVFFGMLFISFLAVFLRKLYKSKSFLYYSTLVATVFIPQVTYIFAYLNQEAYSLASSAFLILTSYLFYEFQGREPKQKRIYFLLGLACGFQLLTKANFYILLFMPFSLILIRIFQRKISLRNLMIFFVTGFVVCGWFFIRNYSLYRDLLGVNTYQRITTSNLAIRSYSQVGWNAYDVLFKTQWLEETASSFYGRFGYMLVKIDPVMQWIFRTYVFLGTVGLIGLLSKTRNIILLIKEKYFYFLFIPLFPINLIISLQNSLYFDFQNQGRYFFPLLIPLMLFTTRGIFEFAKTDENRNYLIIGIVLGSVILSFWSFLYLPKI